MTKNNFLGMVVPHGWEVVPISEVVTITSGQTPKGVDDEDSSKGNVPWFRIADMNTAGNERQLMVAVVNLTNEAASKLKLKIRPTGTIVFPKRGGAIATNKKRLLGVPAAYDLNTMGLIAEEDLTEYIWHWFQTIELGQLSTGTSVPQINNVDIVPLNVPIPPKNEQTRIVTAIESLQQRSSRARTLLSDIRPKLDNLRQSILQAAFSGRLTANWRAKNPDVEPADVLLARIRTERRQRWETAELEKFEAKGKKPPKNWKDKYNEPDPVDDSVLPELPEGWCWASVQQIGSVESGQTPKGCDNHHSDDGEVPWFRVGDMNSEGNEEILRLAEITLSIKDITALKLHIRPAGTIVFPKRGGAIATNKKRVLGQPSAYDLNTMGVVPSVSGSLSEFLWWWFQSIDLAKLADGGVILQINHGDIAPLAIPIPPESEMDAIVKVLREYNKRQNVVVSLLSSMESLLLQLDQSILSKAFRGELVLQDPNDEPASKLLARIRASREAAVAKKVTSKKKAARKKKKSSKKKASAKKPDSSKKSDS